MGACVRLILPDRDEGAQAEILDTIANRYSGLTGQRGFGVWNGPKGRTREPVLILTCSIPEWDEYAECWWDELARHAVTLFGEQCVYLSHWDESAMLVYPDYTDPI